MTHPPIAQAAKALREASCAIASTGAGISVESGIPDFRSAGGIWEKYPPEEYATIEAFMSNPAKVWNLWYDLGAQFGECKPNPAHQALAVLEQAGRIQAVITQNVDNLHQDAGSVTVVEYHGNTKRLRCLECRYDRPYNPAVRESSVPYCECGGLLKPDVIMFGEMIPPQAMLKAESYARNADTVLIVGTSAQVYPAAELPIIAKRHGATIIEINTEPTDFTHTITDHFLLGKAGDLLPQLAQLTLA